MRLIYILYGLWISAVAAEMQQSVWEVMNDTALKEDKFSQYYSYRGPNEGQFDDTEKLMTGFVSQSPCHAMAIKYQCFAYSPKRALEIMHRKWVSHSNAPDHIDLSSADPLSILSKFEGMNILFVGDSTVATAYVTLLCHFSQFAKIDYKIVWSVDDRMVDEFRHQTGCPEHIDCHILAGECTISEFNIVFRYQQLNTYDAGSRQLLHRMVSYLKPYPTVAVINMGAHYGDPVEFAKGLNILKSDFEMWEKTQTHHPNTSWLWTEVSATHFTNGYFSHAEDFIPNRKDGVSVSNNSLMCSPMKDFKAYYEADWMNRLVETHLPEFVNSGRIIRIARPLYDQWDAHIDHGDSQQSRVYKKDCLHYCAGSGAMRLILSETVTSMVRCLEHCPKLTFQF